MTRPDNGPRMERLRTAGAPEAEELADADRHVTALPDQYAHPTREDYLLSPSGQLYQRTHRDAADHPNVHERPAAYREAGAASVGFAVRAALCATVVLAVTVFVVGGPAVDGLDLALLGSGALLLAAILRDERRATR